MILIGRFSKLNIYAIKQLIMNHILIFEMSININKLLVNLESSIYEVLVIQNGNAQIALVVDNKKLLGTISDGDIRRSILKKVTCKLMQN